MGHYVASSSNFYATLRLRLTKAHDENRKENIRKTMTAGIHGPQENRCNGNRKRPPLLRLLLLLLLLLPPLMLLALLLCLLLALLHSLRYLLSCLL
jgi:hypothetical protein